MTADSSASSVSVSETQAPLITCGCKNSCQRKCPCCVRIIAWSRIRDDVGLTSQVWVLKTGSGIQKVCGHFDFRFRAPLRESTYRNYHSYHFVQVHNTGMLHQGLHFSASSYYTLVAGLLGPSKNCVISCNQLWLNNSTQGIVTFIYSHLSQTGYGFAH